MKYYWRLRNKLLFYIPSLLAPSSNNNFNESSSILSILQSGFINNWTAKANYSSYFSQCSPRQCTYSIYERQSIIIIVTNVLSVFSGLSTVLKLLTPVIVQVFYWFLNHLWGMSIVILWLLNFSEKLLSHSIGVWLIPFYLSLKCERACLEVKKGWSLNIRLKLNANVWSSRLYFHLSFVWVILEKISRTFCHPTKKEQLILHLRV